MKERILKLLKICVAFVGCICIFVVNNDRIVLALSDTESTKYGFDVDRDYYQKSKWYNSRVIKVYMCGDVVGKCTVNVGMTRAYEKTWDGYYMDDVFVSCKMNGVYACLGRVGYAEHLIVKSKLPKDTYLMAYSPEAVANDTTYDVGASADSDGTVGISAGTSFTEGGLEINSYSDPDTRYFNTCFDYQHAWTRFTWKLNKYSYGGHTQRCHYTIKTMDSKYETTITVVPKFQIWTDVPSFWASEYNVYRSTSYDIDIVSPY